MHVTPVPSRPTPLSPRRTSLLAASGLSLIAVCYGLARFAYGLFLPAFRAEFDLSASAAGAIGSGSYAAYCAAIVVATLATPRWGARALAMAAGAVATVGTGLVAAAPSGPMLAIGVVVAGTSTGLASPPLADAVSRNVRAERRDRVQTVINAGTGVGVAVSGPLALVAADQWRLAWAISCLLSAAASIWVATAMRGPTGGVPPAAQASDRRASGSDRTPGIRLTGLLPWPMLPTGAVRLLLAALTMGAASAAIWTFGRDLLTHAGGLSPTITAWCWILLGVFGIIAVGTGDLLNRIGLGRSWLAGMFALALATGLAAADPANLLNAATSFGVFGASYIGLTSVLLVWGTRVYGHSPVLGVGLAFLLIAAGQAVATPILGALTDTFGGQWAFAFAMVIALLGTGLKPHSGEVLPGRNFKADLPAGQ